MQSLKSYQTRDQKNRDMAMFDGKLTLLFSRANWISLNFGDIKFILLQQKKRNNIVSLRDYIKIVEL
jgi:hypothetical protein